MFLRRKLLAAAVATCSLLGAPGLGLAQDPSQPSSTPTSPPDAATAQPAVPAPAPAVENAPAPVPGQPAQPSADVAAQGGEETVGGPARGKRGGKQFGEEIVVTGSRIRRKDLTTPAPVAVLSKEQIQASGRVSVGDFLQTLPEQGNAYNTTVNNSGSGATRPSRRCSPAC